MCLGKAKIVITVVECLRMRILNISKKHTLLILITAILFIIPFFWLKPGDMDLGGDGNRLYFYDPVSYLKSTAIYDISGYGKGVVEPLYIYIPYILFIAALRFFVSPTIAIDIVNGLKLSIGFLAVYLIVHEFLTVQKKDKDGLSVSFASVLAGLVYTVSLGTGFISYFWDRALVTHNQILLNPLIFYLLFKYLKDGSFKYLWMALVVSFIFAPNFGPVGGPPFFAFYPLAIFFILICIKLFYKKITVWKKVAIAGLSFLGVHTFHLLAEGVSLFDKDSNLNTIVFSKQAIESGGVAFFEAISNIGKVSQNLLLQSGNPLLNVLSIVVLLIILAGLILARDMRKQMLLTASFFWITLYLVSANITHLGYNFYRLLFYLPGFSMFRHFNSQWFYVYIFFYSLLFGLAGHTILVRLKRFYKRLFFVSVLVVAVAGGWSLFSGDPVNKIIIGGSVGTQTLLHLDPRFEQTLKFIRTLPDDGKFLVLPLTDNFRQLVAGSSGGAYEGPSTLLLLTDKYSFAGYQPFGYLPDDPAPYAEAVMKRSKEKRYEALTQIFATLNIRYILHNTDPRIYDKQYFPDGDYAYMRTSMPESQAAYTDYLRYLPIHKIYSNKPYEIYEFNRDYYNRTIFLPQGIYQASSLSLDSSRLHSVFLNKNLCEQEKFKNLCKGYQSPQVKLNYEMIDPAKYKLTFSNYDGRSPIFLVLQQVFHQGWKLSSSRRVIAEDTHIPVNGYVNGWLISKKELPSTSDFTLFIDLEPQKYFWYGWFVTGAFLILLICYPVIGLFKHYAKNK